MRTCLTGHTGSIHMNALGGRHIQIYTHTHMHTDVIDKQFQETTWLNAIQNVFFQVYNLTTLKFMM